MEIVKVEMEKKQFSEKWLLKVTFEVDSINEIAEINEVLNLRP